MLMAIKELVPVANPTNVLVDVEPASIGAFRNAFQNARVSGYYFHLSQSILRKVNEVGMKEAYERDDEVRGSVRCLAALSCVPVTDIVESFEILAESMPPVEHYE